MQLSVWKHYFQFKLNYFKVYYFHMPCSDLHLVNKSMQVWFHWIVYTPDFKQLTENPDIDYLVCIL